MSARRIICLALMCTACSELAAVERSEVPGGLMDAAVMDESDRPDWMPPQSSASDGGHGEVDGATEDASARDAGADVAPVDVAPADASLMDAAQ